MESSRRVHRVSWRQLEILWEFLNSNRSIATSYNRSLQAKEYSRRKWTEIAEILNSQGGGAHKDWTGWCKYWVDYKAKLKKRVAVVRSAHVRTGGGPSTENPLTEMEEKFLRILGDDFGQGSPGVRVEPFAVPPEIGTPTTPTIDVTVPHSPTSESILVSVLDSPYSIPIQNLPIDPVWEPLPENPPQEPSMVQDQNPPAVSPSSTPTRTPHPTPTPSARSPRRRRRRRKPPMSQEVARRALVRSTQMQAEAASKIAKEMVDMVHEVRAWGNTAKKIERILDAAFPRAAAQENFE